MHEIGFELTNQLALSKILQAVTSYLCGFAREKLVQILIWHSLSKLLYEETVKPEDIEDALGYEQELGILGADKREQFYASLLVEIAELSQNALRGLNSTRCRAGTLVVC